MSAISVDATAVPCIVTTAVMRGAVSEVDAQLALTRLKAALPKTQFESAWPAALPGFVAVRLSDGSVGYTDKLGRYLVLGLIFDTVTGTALDHQLVGNP
jgi:hypothetical protein